MKKLLLVVGAAGLVACMNDRDRHGAAVNEPAGAEMSTNSMQSTPARDINQQPYPGTSDLNEQRGSGSASDSSLQGNSSGNSTGTGTETKSGSSVQNP